MSSTCVQCVQSVQSVQSNYVDIFGTILEIPDFLSAEECDLIIKSAKKNGLDLSNLFGDDIHKEFAGETPLANISRVSQQTWLTEDNLDKQFFRRLQERSESIQKLFLGVGGIFTLPKLDILMVWQDVLKHDVISLL